MKTKIDLRRAIKERGFTIRYVAKKMGVQPPTITQNMINGNPSVRKLEEIAECLGCDITELFYPVEEETAIPQTNEPADGLFVATTVAAKQVEVETPVQGADAKPQDAREMMYCPHCGTKFFVVHVPIGE